MNKENITIFLLWLIVITTLICLITLPLKILIFKWLLIAEGIVLIVWLTALWHSYLIENIKKD